MHAVGAAFAELASSGKVLGVPELADCLRGLGYRVRMRTALGMSGASIDGDCLLNLRHQFLTIMLQGSGALSVTSQLQSLSCPWFQVTCVTCASTPSINEDVAANSAHLKAYHR